MIGSLRLCRSALCIGRRKLQRSARVYTFWRRRLQLIGRRSDSKLSSWFRHWYRTYRWTRQRSLSMTEVRLVNFECSDSPDFWSKVRICLLKRISLKSSVFTTFHIWFLGQWVCCLVSCSQNVGDILHWRPLRVLKNASRAFLFRIVYASAESSRPLHSRVFILAAPMFFLNVICGYYRNTKLGYCIYATVDWHTRQPSVSLLHLCVRWRALIKLLRQRRLAFGLYCIAYYLYSLQRAEPESKRFKDVD